MVQILVPSVVIVSTKSLFGWDDISEISMGAAFTGLISGWLVVGSLLYSIARRSGSSLVDYYGLRFRLKDLVFVPLGVLLQFAMVIVYWPILALFEDADVEKVAQDLGDTARDSGNLGIVLLVVTAVLVAPLMEEILYRGLLFKLLTKASSSRLAILSSAAVFGAVHFQLLQFVGLFLVGVATAYSVHRAQGRLGQAIALHAGFNATTVLAVLVL